MAIYKSDSHLYNTKQNAKFTEFYEPGNALFGSPVEEYEIPPQANQRPDVAANELYGNQRLWWIFMHYNPDTLKDPVIDFKSGIVITVPVQKASATASATRL